MTGVYTNITHCRICGENSLFYVLRAVDTDGNYTGKYHLFVRCPQDCIQNDQQYSNYIVKFTDMKVILAMLKNYRASAICENGLIILPYSDNAEEIINHQAAL